MVKLGKYIVIEGTDGTGKSTQTQNIVQRVEQEGLEAIETNEPGGVAISQELRRIIKDGSLARSAFTNILLLSASRRETWLQQSEAALEAGKWIISSRDYTSTLAYQGYGEDVDLDLIEYITLLSTNEKYINPDHRIILDLDDETERARRITERGKLEKLDAFESRQNDFQQKVIEGYREIAKTKGLPVISANQPIEVITQQIWQIIWP
jgi:dTMP kinase